MIIPFVWPWGFISGGAPDASAMVINMVPTEGQVIELPDTTREIILNLRPLVDLTELEVVLPDNPEPKESQRVFISCTRQIEQFTASASLPVNGFMVMYSPGDNYVWLQNDGQTWSRVIG